MVYAALDQFSSQIAVFDNQDISLSVNYRDLFPEPPPPELAPSCADAGVIGALPGMVGCLQALEVIKLLCGIPSGLAGQLLCLDTIGFANRLLPIRPRMDSPLRRQGVTINDIALVEQACAANSPTDRGLLPSTILDWIREGRIFQLVDVRSQEESANLPFGGYVAPLDSLHHCELQLNRYGPVVLYCTSGIRSLKAYAILRKRFPEIQLFSLIDGTDGLLASGAQPRVMQACFGPNGFLVPSTPWVS